MPRSTLALLALALCAAAPRPALADPVGDLPLATARAVGDAAVAEARRLAAPGGAIAVVDAGGHLAYLVRLDGTFPAAAEVATEKARTAATFQRPTAGFEDAANSGRYALLGVRAMTPLRGGIPIVAAGKVLGAVGVSGAASAAQDEQIAAAAAAARTN